MHIMTTMRCNMRCAHCCYACQLTGKDMEPRTFRRAVDLAVKLDWRIALARGEPTIHPKFWSFVEYALARSNDVFIQTNGKKTDTALTLAKMAVTGIVMAGISKDKWHEPIDPVVVRAFTKEKHDWMDKRFICNIELAGAERGPQKAGRCDWGVEKCPMFGCAYVDVDGNIHECGCKGAPVIGSVFNPDPFIEKYEHHKWGCALGLPNPEAKIEQAEVKVLA